MNYLFFWNSQCHVKLTLQMLFNINVHFHPLNELSRNLNQKLKIPSFIYFARFTGRKKCREKNISEVDDLNLLCVSPAFFIFFIFFKKEKEHNGSYEMPRNICAWKHSLHNDKVTVASACLCFS